MGKPLVTVIIPVYNRAWCIGRAVESVVRQTYRPMELIVMDDGSTDGSGEAAMGALPERRQSSLHRDKPGGGETIKWSLSSANRGSTGTSPVAASGKSCCRINHKCRHTRAERCTANLEFCGNVEGFSWTILQQENRGVSAARNAAIGKARGELIALLDSDDEWLPEKTEKQVAQLVENEGLLINQTDEIWIRRGQRVNQNKRHWKQDGDLFEKSLDVCAISPSAVMMRRELLDRVGLFDESLSACEDYDLWLRVTCRYPVGLVRENLIVKHGGHEDQLSATAGALDVYRIRAIMKLLDSGVLNEEQRVLARGSLQEKCRIYALGCRKRGKNEEAREVEELPGRFNEIR